MRLRLGGPGQGATQGFPRRAASEIGQRNRSRGVFLAEASLWIDSVVSEGENCSISKEPPIAPGAAPVPLASETSTLSIKWNTTRLSLIGRLKSRDDQEAWREFDRLYGDLIVSYARRRGLGLADAEDLRQVVLMSLLTVMKSFEFQPGRGRFRSYLGRIVGNAVFRFRERPFRRSDVLELDEVLVRNLPCPEEHDALWEQEWVDHHLRRAMETVRRTFEPRSVEAFHQLLAGHGTAEVAEALETTTDAVHKMKQRIRQRLKELIAEQVLEEGEGIL